MKKNLPLMLIGGGVLVVLIAVFVVFKSFKNATSDTASPSPEVVAELPQSQWPVILLIPTEDVAIKGSLGHLLDMKVQKINVPGAATMDYLLVYSTNNGGQQGVPGTIDLKGGEVDKNLLLGSESSGKYRFDAGVSQGTVTLTFRNAEGKSLGKVESTFHLQQDETTLTSADGKFTYTLDKQTKGVWFTTLPTLIQPDSNPNMVTWANGYGVFSSDGKPHSGK